MYVDDTTVYCIGQNIDQVISSLNVTMKEVLMWSVKNRLTIHPIKTEAMILKKSEENYFKSIIPSITYYKQPSTIAG